MKLIASDPVPLIYVEIPDSSSAFNEPPFEEIALLAEASRLADRDLLSGTLFRGVSLASLPIVIRTGIDVNPPNAVFFADQFFGKAWEYGDLPKLVLVLDGRQVDRSYREVPATTPPEELAQLRATFPTELRSTDGIWLSRLRADDRRLAKPYEAYYGLWIPGDPLKALCALLVFARRTDAALAQVERSLT